MSRSEAKLEINRFVGGLNTDATELTTPENTTVDEDNFDLLKEGTRRRRRGMDVEDAATTELGLDGVSMFVSNHRWTNVAKIGGLNFEVIQTGNTLRFYDASVNPLVDGEKSFTVDLNDFRAPLADRTDLYGVSVASGKGVLFVVGEKIRPFYIEYDVINDAITNTEIFMKIRDLSQLDDQSPESGTLTANRRYDLLNQGWYQTGVIIGSSTQIIKIKTKSSNPNTSLTGYAGTILDGYIERFLSNPPKTKPWWVGRGTVTVDIHIKKSGIFNDTKETREVDAFTKEAFDLYYGGNTLAPLGHYIVDPFYKDRSAVSGVDGLDVEVETRRPAACSFYGGRVFYGLHNSIYFSQVILDDLTAAGRCYQEADPTAEDSIGLVASDGGVITIPDMGDIIRLFVVEGALLIFAENGVWSIYSPQGRGFNAVDFTADFVTNLGASGYHSIVDVEGYPVYWGDKGIYAINTAAERIAYEVVDMTENRLKNYYANISPLSRKYAKGAYDLENKRIIWVWRASTDANDNRFLFNRVLNYSRAFDAFFPYSVNIHDAGGDGLTRAIAGIVNANATATATVVENVVVDNNPDPFASDIRFHYPLSTEFEYEDIGPNSLADATPNGVGAIDTHIGFPRGSGYSSSSTTGLTFLGLPVASVPDRGTLPWTYEFWISATDFSSSSAITKCISRFQSAFGNSGTKMSIGVNGFEQLTVGLTAADLTATVFTGTHVFNDDDSAYVSVTRNGANMYVHINGILDGTINVGSQSFNFTTGNGGVNRFRFFEDEDFTRALDVAKLGDVKWTNAARYTAANYTIPIYGGNQVESLNDGDVIVSRTYLTESSQALKYMVLINSDQEVTEADLSFGDFSDETFEDWVSSGDGDNYTSYLETFYHLADDSMLYMQAPWVYTYMTRSSTTFPSAEGDGSISSGDVGGAWTGT